MVRILPFQGRGRGSIPRRRNFFVDGGLIGLLAAGQEGRGRAWELRESVSLFIDGTMTDVSSIDISKQEGRQEAGCPPQRENY